MQLGDIIQAQLTMKNMTQTDLAKTNRFSKENQYRTTFDFKLCQQQVVA